jgi:hypothetical protein
MSNGVVPNKATATSGKRTRVIRRLAVNIEVTELGFRDDYDLTEWSSRNLISGAVWKKTSNPNKPVCYKKSSSGLKLTPKLKMNPALSSAVTISLKADSSNPAIEFRKDGISLSGTELQLTDVAVTSGSLEDKVKITNMNLEWSYSLNGSKWNKIGSTGPHKIYQVQSTPLESTLYDFALEKACGYVNGNSDVAGKINQGIANDLLYDPNLPHSGHPLEYYYPPRRCLCANNAILLRYLCRSIGLNGSVVYIWGGRANNEVFYYYQSSGSGGGSFRVLAPHNDFANANPHFSYHAETTVNGNTYDPSYGNNGLINLNETAPGASRQTGSNFPPAITNFSTWSCPH